MAEFLLGPDNRREENMKRLLQGVGGDKTGLVDMTIKEWRANGDAG